MEKILKPTIDALKAEGIVYQTWSQIERID